MMVHECILRVQTTFPFIDPRGVVGEKLVLPRAFVVFKENKFSMTNSANSVRTIVRVLEWANSHTEAAFRYLTVNGIINEMKMKARESMKLSLDDSTKELYFTCLDRAGNPKEASPIEVNSSDEDKVVELVDIIRPYLWFHINLEGMKKQAIPKTFIEAAGLQDTEVLHIKPRGSNMRWMVELTKRRPKSYIYEMKEGWEEFVVDNRLVGGRKYLLWSKLDDKNTIVFDINNIHHN